MFADQLKKYRELTGMTQDALAERLTFVTGNNFIGSNIRSYETGTNPKLDTIYALASILNIPVQYLFDDNAKELNKIAEHQIAKDPDRYRGNFLKPSEVRGVKKVPLCEESIDASCLEHLRDNDAVEFVYVDNYAIKRQFRNKETRAMHVIGDSMTPYVDDDDIVLFSPIKDRGRHLQDGKYVIEKNGALMVKNLTFKADGGVVISSDNQKYQNEDLNPEQAKSLIKVVGFVVGRQAKS